MEEIKEQLAYAISKNDEMCKRILSGKISEHEAVYLEELPGKKTLTDREIYIYHKAFNEGVKAVLQMLALKDKDEDLLGELLEK